jgi:2-methylisocitrate lyase-like PEP mutase family enzyme
MPAMPANGSAAFNASAAPAAFTAFADLHRGPAPLLLPNAWDSASAALFAEAGFAAVATTSLGVAAAAGRPDGAGVTRDATLRLARALGGGPYLLSVDAEDGYATDPAQVADFAAELAAAGAVGLNLEDGRPDGTLSDPAAHAAKIAAVKAAVPGLFVNARTDTHWRRTKQHELTDRLKAYRDAGADGVFVPGLQDPAEISALVSAVELPLNLLYRPGGPSIAELGELGVRRVSLGSLPFRAALGAALDTVTAIRDGKPAGLDALSFDRVQGLSRSAE